MLLIITLIALNSNVEYASKNLDLNDLYISDKYYISSNQDRYQNYALIHPELNPHEIISIINTNRDYEEYSLNNYTDTSKDNLMLVNKYNKLESNYIPTDLVDIDLKYAYEGRKIKKEVYDSFINMYNDALKEDINLLIISAYRDYDYQNQLYNNYINTYGVDYTNNYSARPGYSEHQSGLALDIISTNTSLDTFYKSNEYKWLLENSSRYGFILRYPKDKENITGYAYEPWHYRYVGIDTALKIKKENITFDEYYAFYLNN